MPCPPSACCHSKSAPARPTIGPRSNLPTVGQGDTAPGRGQNTNIRSRYPITTVVAITSQLLMARSSPSPTDPSPWRSSRTSAPQEASSIGPKSNGGPRSEPSDSTWGKMLTRETCAAKTKTGRRYVGFTVWAGLGRCVSVRDACSPSMSAPRSRSRRTGAEDGGAVVSGCKALARIPRR